MRSTPTPKQPQAERLKDWYPYYAGFTANFVDAALSSHFSAACSLIDPWNGSGTTTAVAASRGLSCVGLDINPAVTVVARARLTPVRIKESLEPLADEIVLAAQREAPSERDNEPLARWLRRPAIATIRGLQRGVNAVLVGDPELELDLAHAAATRTTSLPLLAAFYYTALFAAVRDLLTPFRSSNPTWLRYPTTHLNRISPSSHVVVQAFRYRVRYLADRLRLTTDATADRAQLFTRSALNLSGIGLYDACLSSPPYATRVDYVRSTIAELSVLGLRDDRIAELRSSTTGTPTVRGSDRHRRRLMSPYANATLIGIETHGSHGSFNYYGPWLRSYLGDLETSLLRICGAVKRTGRIGLVVQDSHYKAIHIDLPRIIVETMQSHARDVIDREDYSVSHSLARMNPAARKHLSNRTNHESLLVFA